MHDPRIVVRSRIPVVLIRGASRHDGVDQQSGAVEGGAEASDEGALFDIGAEGERAGGAAEDVGGGGLGEGQTVAEIEEGGRSVDSAGYSAPGCLGVDGELLGGVAGPNSVDVVLVVAVKERGVEDDAVVGAQSAQIAAGGLWDDEEGPACAIGGGLGPQALADGVKSVGCHA